MRLNIAPHASKWFLVGGLTILAIWMLTAIAVIYLNGAHWAILALALVGHVSIGWDIAKAIVATHFMSRAGATSIDVKFGGYTLSIRDNRANPSA